MTNQNQIEPGAADALTYDEADRFTMLATPVEAVQNAFAAGYHSRDAEISLLQARIENLESYGSGENE
jgi:hypothetical protein